MLKALVAHQMLILWEALEVVATVPPDSHTLARLEFPIQGLEQGGPHISRHAAVGVKRDQVDFARVAVVSV
jgi:hypothetical protein